MKRGLRFGATWPVHPWSRSSPGHLRLARLPRRALRHRRPFPHTASAWTTPNPRMPTENSARSIEQLPQNRPQLQHRPAAMAEGVLDAWAEFAEGLMIL